MSTTLIQNPQSGESLVAIQPSLEQQLPDAGWLQRLSLFTGRALSDTALDNEQAYRAGRLTILGQAVTPGTVQGLDLSVDLTLTDPLLMVNPGYGIAANGQDVTLPRSMKANLSGIPVLNGDTAAYIADFAKFTAPAGQAWAGVLLLQPIVVQVPGSAVDSGAANLIVSGNLDASCDQDPTEDAFGDLQKVDGVRLVFLTWPSAPGSLALPAALPAATWRNRVAYTIFSAEQALGADDYLPWEFFGVPLALIAFDTTAKPLFVDRSSVVRTGGRPRRRYILPGTDAQTLGVIEPALANARVNQLAEQLGQVLTPLSPAGLISSEFALLPPSGLLPAYTMDFVKHIASWCPSNWNVSAAPVYAEELEGFLQTGITAAPLDTTQSETIEILVPLPDAVYDPSVLVTEVVDPVFQNEINAATLARNVVLQHQKIIQLEANAIAPLLAQPVIDLNAGLTSDEISGRDGTSVFTADSAEAFGTASNGNGGYVSIDLQNLQKTAAAAPYTITAGSTTIPLFNTDDWADLSANGLQHFVTRIQNKIDSANDLLDLGFLTAQTDIYRYRQNVLGTTDASRLSVSPILANIATGDTAGATAQNIQGYLSSIVPSTTPATTTTPAPATTIGIQATPRALSFSTALQTNLGATLTSVTASKTISPIFTSGITKIGTIAIGTASETVAKAASANLNLNLTTFTPVKVGTASNPASSSDITQQQPIVGAQLNLRTLTIAERLAPSPSQEALFYSIGNRIAFLQLLAALEITVADIPILVDEPTGTSVTYTMADLQTGFDATRNATLLQALNNPTITTLSTSTNPDESTLFSTGVHVLDQHTQLMRAVEARIQQYQDFVNLCQTALGNLRADVKSIGSLLTRLSNDLLQTRQNLAFVQSLLGDEQTRVAGVNATRASVLATYVSFVAYTRPRTLLDTARTPSRQLVPAAVTNPVPACLQQSVSIPPELREMVALLREAPVRWFPPIVLQIGNLERPSLLQDLATSVQTRAVQQLQSPLRVSSALSAPGVYSNSIASVYSSGQQVFRAYQTQRSAFDATQLISQSWATQVATVQNTAAIADLMNSDSVHSEVANAASRSLQQISSVATCLYTRVSNTLPIDRLEWAEFLQNTGTNINLRSLAVLPGWNSQDYTDRQQMQLLVDWLFQQIDNSDSVALGIMSDLIAVAILLASNAPVDNIIAGAVSARANATAGQTIRLTLPSDRVGHGMYVQVYSGASLAARAVVSDLDSTGVTATITDVYKSNVTLQANDIAHFTAQKPDAVVYKAFAR